LAATLPSVCPRAAVATDVAYHHRYDCVCMTTGRWTIKRLRVSREALYIINDYYFLLLMEKEEGARRKHVANSII